MTNPAFGAKKAPNAGLIWRNYANIRRTRQLPTNLSFLTTDHCPMIHVLATIELVPGARDQFLAAFHALMPHVHAEDGCIEYGPTVDVATSIGAQIPLRPDVVTIVEKWRDLPALEAHLVAPHMLPYRAEVKPIVVGTKLQILEPA